MERPGQFSQHGHITDIDPSTGVPKRLQFKSDKVLALRAFDVDDRRSVWVLNDVFLQIILVGINNAKLVGRLKNGPVSNFPAWTTIVIITLADLVMLTSQFPGLFEIHILGSP